MDGLTDYAKGEGNTQTYRVMSKKTSNEEITKEI
jgi:hypothetical protein